MRKLGSMALVTLVGTTWFLAQGGLSLPSLTSVPDEILGRVRGGACEQLDIIQCDDTPGNRCGSCTYLCGGCSTSPQYKGLTTRWCIKEIDTNACAVGSKVITPGCN